MSLLGRSVDLIDKINFHVNAWANDAQTRLDELVILLADFTIKVISPKRNSFQAAVTFQSIS